ncbi:molybdate ABC transporter substrate-binding protein [Loktanella sp. IMCC34160]|uniref:molybdate ABC transporter substrate-binding protein n=1 Tax=Loktanella sp. IMCC34160 TaxID=2510646 RepID=UPI00101BE8CA|nr:molybdate ABC transporter substrate-binding protein [Loktanella sp. IMCC34160]RYG92257.1 molybdate ABC transporter substrate-binding protein [Loktanella sp. IMCC34160]
MLRAAVLFSCLLTLPVPAQADRVTIFAAASLKTALDAIEPGAEAATGHDLILVYAGTSALARQIAYGAPADIFISANPDWMDDLSERGLIRNDTRTDLLGNRIVLIGHGPGATVDMADAAAVRSLLGSERIAMAFVDAVPAGIYGKNALQDLGLWDEIAAQVVQTDNVRAALALVARGEARFGVTYATDAVADPSVTVLGTFPEDSHPPITYPIAALTTGAADVVLSYLAGPEAGAIFAQQGFTRPEASR